MKSGDSFRFFVSGPPQGKGRPRVTKYGTYTPGKTRKYEKQIRSVAMLLFSCPVCEYPMSLHVDAKFPVPESWPKWKKDLALDGRMVPTCKPDGDNVLKIVADALQGVLYKDDVQLMSMSIVKTYSTTPGLDITVSTAGQSMPSTMTRKSDMAQA